MAGSPLGEGGWQGPVVAAVLAVWLRFRTYCQRGPRGPRKTAASVEMLSSVLSCDGRGGGGILLLAEAVLCGWYIGYIGLGTSLLMHPCRLQLFVSAFPLPGCLMQWIAYSLVVFRNAAASVVPP